MVKKNFIRSCKRKCDINDINCLNLCNKPLIDIERFNYDIMKRMTKVFKNF